MITLKNKDTGATIGTLTDAQLQFLIDQLEEESREDTDYWLNRAQIEIFKEQGADPALVAMLEQALGDSDDMEVMWEQG
ncbi:MAG: hypothetical protein PHE17_14230 [Thiothrix sp.]|uniref:hypothetical protein n=1 Tax=Thiothrix sp. TaxID=1032 RepID=UPI002613AA83|nr:hypothetical protein [Thiothrix sp.]MDD5394166.1 hypothetical protein [Thiothrix sp.]